MEAFALSPDAPRVPLPQRLLSDERLLRMIAAGNAQAFGAVYSRYHAPLYAYCRSIVRDPDDARDALQNTMLKALAALNRGQDRELALKPWLFRIAHNESVSLLRKRRPSEPLTDAVTPPVAGVEGELAARERLSQLVADLQELPERQRSALIMREVNGLSYDEIAGALSIAPGAARQTVFEARSALQEYGEGREVACENIRRSISDGDGRAMRARRVRAHLRACNQCRDFQTTLTVRRRDLGLLAPGLSGGAVFALLEGVLGAGIVGGGAAVGGGAVGGVGLIGGTASTLMASSGAKSVVAIVAATAAGAGAVQLDETAHLTSRAKTAVAPGAAVASASASASPSSAEATNAAPTTPEAESSPTLVDLPDATLGRADATLDRGRRAAGIEGDRGRGRGRGDGRPGPRAGAGFGGEDHHADWAGDTAGPDGADGRRGDRRRGERMRDGRREGDGPQGAVGADDSADDYDYAYAEGHASEEDDAQFVPAEPARRRGGRRPGGREGGGQDPAPVVADEQPVQEENDSFPEEDLPDFEYQDVAPDPRPRGRRGTGGGWDGDAEPDPVLEDGVLER